MKSHVIVYIGSALTHSPTVNLRQQHQTCCHWGVYAHEHRHSANINDSSLHLLCTETDKRLLNNAVSIYCLSVCSPPPPLSISPASQTTTWKKRTCSLWIGQEVVRGLLLSALLLACLWHLGFYCSAFHQQTKTQPKQIKPSLSSLLPVCHTVLLQPHWSIWKTGIIGMLAWL